MKTILKLAILILILAVPRIGMSNSYFSDSEKIEGNSISTGIWGEPAAPEVVINEVMWMGSTVNWRDEWIELRNTTNDDIDIGQWRIENAKSNHHDYMIPANKIIPANGFFLIANNPSQSAGTALNVDPDVTSAGISLANSDNGDLVLKDSDGNVIDKAKGDPWAAGNSDGSASGLHQSMERNDTPGDGLSAGSWHTCTVSGCQSGSFWDTAGGNNYGTPDSPNLSKNDSTETNLDFYSTPGKVGFRLTGEGLPLFEKAEYTIIYGSEQGEQAIKGSVDIDGKSEVKVDGLLLGTCSSGGICVFHSGVTTVNLEVILSGPITRTLTAKLDF